VIGPSSLTPSLHSQRLRAVAARYAPSLLAEGVRGVAATGSVGRGDADVGSDLDLWVIADDDGTSHDAVDGVPITVMRVSEGRVFDLDVLSGVEVGTTHVIADPDGVFARVLDRFADHATEIRSGNVIGARDRLDELVASARHGTPQGRLWALRTAAHLACALRLYADTGLMMPKMRHFRRQLPTGVYSMLRDIHGLDDVVPDLATLIEASTSIADRMSAELQRLAIQPLPIERPCNALLKLEHGDIDDGVLMLRAFFETRFVDQVLAALPRISMVRYLLESCEPDIRWYWETLHGLAATSEAFARKVDATSVGVQELLDQLGVHALNSDLAPS
jgi:hypothetical protein